ncbi:MAG: response regulator, partial [bacterium]
MIKVLIIDDSALVREILSRIIDQEKDMEVVATAMDPYYAVEKIKRFRPDVITLDVEMPRMNGLDFLKRLMSSHPLPVIMISSWTKANSEATIKALEIGAVDFVAKPENSLKKNLYQLEEELTAKIRTAAISNLSNLQRKHSSTIESN